MHNWLRVIPIFLLSFTFLFVTPSFAEEDTGQEVRSLEEQKNKCSEPFTIEGTINSANAAKLEEKIATCLREGEVDIYVSINSGGGFAVSGFAMIDILRYYDIHDRLHTINFGSIASSAIVPYLAPPVNRRLIGCRSKILLHNPLAVGAMRHSIPDIEFLLEEQVNIYDNYISVIVESTLLSREALIEMMNKKTELDAKKAVEHGFASVIVGC